VDVVAELNHAERTCLTRYCALLADRLDLVEVRMFGSAARGDMWPPGSPMHSDVDLLVVTRDEVPRTTAPRATGITTRARGMERTVSSPPWH
jgi:predicted nucleotidyltransferase